MLLTKPKQNFPKKSFIIRFIILIILISCTVAGYALLEKYSKTVNDKIQGIALTKNLQKTLKKDLVYHILYLSQSKYFFLFLFVIGYNVWDAYKSVLLLFGYCICFYLQALIKLILQKRLREVKGVYCHYGFEYSTPPKEAVTSCYVFLAIARLICYEATNKFCIATANAFAVILILFINCVLLIQNDYLLEEIFLGMMLGLMVFFFVYYIDDIQTIEPNKKCTKLIKKNTVVLIFMYNLLFGVLCFFYFIAKKSKETENMNKEYQISCVKQKNKKVELEAIVQSIFSLAYLSIFFSYKMEFLYLCNKNKFIFIKRNFYKEKKEYDNLSINSKATRKSTDQWNQTNFFKVLGRILIDGLIICIYVSLSYCITLAKNQYLMLAANAVLVVAVVFVLVFGNKILFKKLSLTN